MSHILEIEDKDNSDILIKATLIDLINYKNLGIEFVHTTTCNDQFVCEECKKMALENISIDSAIEINPIPRRCKNKYCRCWYIT